VSTILPVNDPPPPVSLVDPSVYRRTLLGEVDERFLKSSGARWLAGVLMAVALIVPSAQSVVRIGQTDTSLFREGGQRQRTALGRWLPTAHLVLENKPDENPYGYGHWFPTPPAVLLSIAPLSLLPYRVAGLIWATFKGVGLFVALWALVRALQRSAGPIPFGILLMVAVFSLRPVISDLQHGNLNIFVAIWIAAGWASALRNRDAWAGLFIALAIVTKITPALLLVYFAYKRWWRLCGGTLLWSIVLWLLAPSLLLGWDRNWEYLRTWFDMLIAPYALHSYVTYEPANQSLYGTVLRLMADAGWLPVEHMPAEQALRAGMEDMIRPISTLGRLLKPAISLGILGGLAWLCRGRSTDRRDLRTLLELALVLVAMLLLSERTWKHHATTLPLIYLPLWIALAGVGWSDRFRAWGVAMVGGQFALVVASGEGVFGDGLAERLLDGGAFCWGLVLCAVQLGSFRWRLGRLATG
jgi:alpha-1,2-mannosyltransferase